MHSGWEFVKQKLAKININYTIRNSISKNVTYKGKLRLGAGKGVSKLDCFALMVEEHQNITRMLKVIRKYCYLVLKNELSDCQVFFKLIDFVRNYADKHHHGKEELLLFDKMVAELGPVAEQLIKYGMLNEHDLGRLYMQQLESAVENVLAGDDEAKLDLIANAIAYTDLLTRHIHKEDTAVYKFAAKNLAPETIRQINEQCIKFEAAAADQQIKEKYLILLADLEHETGLVP